MKVLVHAVRRFLQDESGPTAVEYAVMLAFIILVCITIIKQVGTSTSKTFSTMDSALS